MPVEKRTKTWSDTTSANDDAVRDLHHIEGEVKHLRDELAQDVKGLNKQKEDEVYGSRRFFTSRRFLFPLGLFIGAVFALAVYQPGELQAMPATLALLLNEYDLSLSLPALPQFDMSLIETEWRRFTSQIPEPWKLNNDGREFRVGDAMKQRGLTAKYPVVLVPGIISTGLESWSTSPEYRAFFRQKVWGGFHMLSQVTFNREKWMAAIMLDPVTGIDPPDVKVRAAEGLDAASSFIQGYWIWSKIIENLAVVNYDTNNMFMAPYDWRLTMYNLEERDGYFTKLKSTIESLKKKQKQKTVIASHSMGSTVMLYFLKWVESPEHGGGGPTWVEDHIEAFISIAGTHLGVVKAMAAFLSGEMKDTVQMNPVGEYVLERFFSKKERQKLFRSWAGSASMWIKGGEDVWGNATHAPDDEPGNLYSHGELISFRNEASNGAKSNESEDSASSLKHESTDPLAIPVNMTVNQAGTWILEHTPVTFQRMFDSNYSNGIERDEAQLERNDGDHRKWTNPLESRLPNAPSMKLYCVYGHGKETERSYWYTAGPYEHDDSFADAGDASCSSNAECEGMSLRVPLDMPLSRTSSIDKDFTNEDSIPKVRNGVKMGEGDGTVSLLSLGAMCAEGWKRPRWNPAGIRITTVELPHRPVSTIPRGGANTSDHVDILGSTGLNELILKVATGAGDEIENNYFSRIQEYAQRINWDG